MKDRTFSLAIAGFPYGGNGGSASEHPAVGKYLTEVVTKAKADPRIEGIHSAQFSDTPITMTRNESVLWARSVGADFLLMVDSDMQPDCELGEDPEAKPFWDTSFDFVMEHFDEGPNVVCAPYCGPPPNSNVYVFYWNMMENDCPDAKWKMEQYGRDVAARMIGIQPVAAQPTGLILFDMRAFELTDPEPYYKHLRSEGMDREEAMRHTHPWFYYEYTDIYQSKKASTEDVTATRDLSFMGHLKFKRDVIYCNWDAWAGHVKPKIVRKPRPVDSRAIHAQYRHAVEAGTRLDEKLMMVRPEPPMNGDVKRPKTNGREDTWARAAGPKHPYGKPLGNNGPTAHRECLTRITKGRKHHLGCSPKVVEIGSWVGESAIAFEKGGASVLCIDTWKGSPSDPSEEVAKQHDVFQQFEENVRSYYPNIKWWKATSQSAALKLSIHQRSILSFGEFLPADIIHIDAEHTYEACKQDILAWLPLVADDGIMIGHDYFSPLFPGVHEAVHEVFGTEDVEAVEVTEKNGGFWLVRMENIDRDEILNRFREMESADA